jgi:hypothetical protein
MQLVKLNVALAAAIFFVFVVAGIAAAAYSYRFSVVLPTACVMKGSIVQLPSLSKQDVGHLMSVQACVTRDSEGMGQLTVLISNNAAGVLAIEDIRCLTDTRVTGIPSPPYVIGPPNSVCDVTPVRPYERVLVNAPIYLHGAYKPETIVRDLVSREGYVLRLLPL